MQRIEELGQRAKGEKYVCYTVEDARKYDDDIAGLVPGYPSMLEAIVDQIAQFPAQPAVLDLGSGTGNLARLILNRSPRRVRLVDSSPAMCMRAQAKLLRLASQVEIQCLDLHEADLREGIVVSTLTLHECLPERRQLLLRRLAHRLVPGGALIVGDYYQPSEWNRRAYAELIRKHAARCGIAPHEIELEIREHLADPTLPRIGDDFAILAPTPLVPPRILFESSGIVLWMAQRECPGHVGLSP